MTLRQLLTHSEKSVRDLIDHTQSGVLATIIDFRDLTRPVRRKSHYPTLLATLNALNRLLLVHKELQTKTEYIHERLEEIREHARKERLGRSIR